jgi:hypothetical protein
MSAVEGNPEAICSDRVLLGLTHSDLLPREDSYALLYAVGWFLCGSGLTLTDSASEAASVRSPSPMLTIKHQGQNVRYDHDLRIWR